MTHHAGAPYGTVHDAAFRAFMIGIRWRRDPFRRIGPGNSSLKVLLRAFVILIVALPFLAIAAVLMCFQDRPLVSRSAQLTPQDIEKAKRILDEHDPRKSGPDRLQIVAIEERDLETTLNYLVSRVGH